MRDPYALYARQVLRLKALDTLDADPGAAERGQFVHDALDAFVKAWPQALPADALGALLDEGRKVFGEMLGHPAVAAFWWPRFERLAAWFLGFERDRRAAGTRPVATEIEGRLAFQSNGRPFTLIARADRIDRLADGRLAIIDYKTGRVPRPAEVLSGASPQLPLEAVIAREAGFGDIRPTAVGELGFLRLGGGNPAGEWAAAVGSGDLDAAVAEAWAGLLALIAAFDDPAMPYRSRPRPELAFAGDYDHLARIEEWESAP
jgi:ATP-dependent helicase/nuclease subunit B